MEPLLQLKCFKIQQVNGEYRLYQLVSWRSLANYFYVPVILGFGGPVVVLDQARVQALNANGTIRVVTDTYRSPVSSPVYYYGTGAGGAGLLTKVMEESGWIGSYISYAVFGFNLLIILGTILLLSLQKSSEVRRLKSLGLWGPVIPDNATFRAERRADLYERVIRPSRKTQKRWVRLFIIMDIVFGIMKIGVGLSFFIYPQTVGSAILLSFSLLFLIFLPLLTQGYPGRSLFMRKFPIA